MGALGDNFICEARRYGERVHCGRCDIVSEPGGELVCKTVAECGLVLSLLRQAVEDEAERIDGSNDAAAGLAERLIAEGKPVVPGPYRDRLRRAAALRAAGRLIARIESDEGIKARLKGKSP